MWTRKIIIRFVLFFAFVVCSAKADDWGVPLHDKLNSMTTSDIITPPLVLNRTINMQDYWKGALIDASWVPSYSEVPIGEMRIYKGKLILDGNFPSLNSHVWSAWGAFDLRSTFTTYGGMYRFGTLCVGADTAGLPYYDAGYHLRNYLTGERIHSSVPFCFYPGNWGGSFNAEDDYLYVLARAWDIGNSSLWKLRRNGNIYDCIWKAPGSLSDRQNLYMYIRAVAVPLILEDKIVVMLDGRMWAFDKNDGHRIWAAALNPYHMYDVCPNSWEDFTFGPTYANGLIYSRGKSPYYEYSCIIKTNPSDGSLVETVPLMSEFPTSLNCDYRQFIVHNGLIIVSYRWGIEALVDNQIGNIAWVYELDGSTNPDIMLSGELIYSHSGNRVFCLNATTGELVWEYTLPTKITRILLAQNKLWALSSEFLPPEEGEIGCGWKDPRSVCRATTPYIYVLSTADFDNDGDVDVGDFFFFQGCFHGPNTLITSLSCEKTDVDGDLDVDLDDFLVFQKQFNGPNRSPH